MMICSLTVSLEGAKNEGTKHYGFEKLFRKISSRFQAHYYIQFFKKTFKIHCPPKIDFEKSFSSCQNFREKRQ